MSHELEWRESAIMQSVRARDIYSICNSFAVHTWLLLVPADRFDTILIMRLKRDGLPSNFNCDSKKKRKTKQEHNKRSHQLHCAMLKPCLPLEALRYELTAHQQEKALKRLTTQAPALPHRASSEVKSYHVYWRKYSSFASNSAHLHWRRHTFF